MPHKSPTAHLLVALLLAALPAHAALLAYEPFTNATGLTYNGIAPDLGAFETL